MGQGRIVFPKFHGGSYPEYSDDINYIPHDCDWQAGDFPPEDSIYLWGPEMPKDFVHNYEAGDAQA